MSNTTAASSERTRQDHWSVTGQAKTERYVQMNAGQDRRIDRRADRQPERQPNRDGKADI